MTEIKIDLPDEEKEEVIEEKSDEVIDDVVVDELSQLREREAERTAQDIADVKAIAEEAKSIALMAQENSNRAIEMSVKAVVEVDEIKVDDAIDEIEDEEPAKEVEHDIEPERKHWFWR